LKNENKVMASGIEWVNENGDFTFGLHPCLFCLLGWSFV